MLPAIGIRYEALNSYVEMPDKIQNPNPILNYDYPSLI